MKQFLLIISIGSILMAFAGCSSTGTSLHDIRSNPEFYAGKRVRVQGLVTDSISVPIKKGVLYRIFENNKDSVWVYTERDGPERGEQVYVEGTISDNESIRSKIVGVYILEEKCLEK